MDTKETGHTPGPWTYDVEKVSGPHLETTTIFAHGDVIGYAHRDSQRDNSQANARLIASAPAMLAALDGILNGKGDGCGRPSAAELEAARTAIAQARGGVA